MTTSRHFGDTGIRNNRSKYPILATTADGKETYLFTSNEEAILIHSDFAGRSTHIGHSLSGLTLKDKLAWKILPKGSSVSIFQ